jgi:hypothetical protein
VDIQVLHFFALPAYLSVNTLSMCGLLPDLSANPRFHFARTTAWIKAEIGETYFRLIVVRRVLNLTVTKDTFHDHLSRATVFCHDFTRRYVHNALPASFLYSVRLNQSYDGNPLKDGEQVFPDDTTRHGSVIAPLDESAVVALLWRDGLVPEWINISVERADSEQPHFELRCCGRFTDRTEHLYYSQTECCPFGVKGPVLPHDWKESDGRFDFRWRDERNA